MPQKRHAHGEVFVSHSSRNASFGERLVGILQAHRALKRQRQSASGSGRTWKWTTLACEPFPVSL
jgi:hypothetical protein